MAGKHAVFSPSAAERWMTCPGSVKLSASLPDDSSPYADEGTKAHKLFELLLTGQPFEVDDYPLDMVQHVTRSVDQALQLIPDGVDFLTEEPLVLNEHVFGTADLVIPEHFGTLTIVDFKYGQGVPVGAVEENGEPNLQLLLYASMAAKKWGDDFTQVRLVILQPRVDAGLQTDVTLPMDLVFKIRDRVAAAVAEGSKPDAALVPSKKGCKWCKAKAVCPALTQEANAVVPATSSIPTLSPERVAEILDKRAQVEDYFTAVYSYAMRLAEAGVTVPGYCLKPKRAFTRWKPGAEKAAEKSYGQWLFERALISPAQAKKVLTGKEGDSFIEEWTESTSSGMNLVKEKSSNADLLF